MSFSDFGRPATVEVSSSFEKPSSPRGVQRLNKLPPTLRHFQRKDNNGCNSSQPEEETLGSNKNDNNTATTTVGRFTPPRGVRPRLEARNPVTNEPLLVLSPTDDVVSVASTVTNGFDDLDDSKDALPPPVTPSPQRPSDSLFAGLHKEIINFQVRIILKEKGGRLKKNVSRCILIV